MDITIHKSLTPISGNVVLPGSKSISNRLLIIKALSGSSLKLINISNADDTVYLQKALNFITNKTNQIIDIGHAGTDMRFLTAYLSTQKGSWTLTGSERIQQRPIKELVDVLTQLGADITYQKNEGFPPLIIKGKTLLGGNVCINGSISSQFISALLLCAPYFKNGLNLTLTHKIVSLPYITMTVELMKEFGVSINWVNNTIDVEPIPYSFSQFNYSVESDWSAASYFYSIVALSPLNTTISLQKLGKNSLQADVACGELFGILGVTTSYNNDCIVLKKITCITKFISYDFTNCPDIAQTLVCCCIGLNIEFNFTGLQTLKLKETDRLLSLQQELKKLGVVVEITNNSISYPKISIINKCNPISIETYNDHRMAMSFAPLSLILHSLIIKNSEVVSKSYPLFWDDFAKLSFSVNNTV